MAADLAVPPRVLLEMERAFGAEIAALRNAKDDAHRNVAGSAGACSYISGSAASIFRGAPCCNYHFWLYQARG